MDQLGDETEARRVQNSTGGESDGATGTLYREDRVSLSGLDAGHMVTGRWGPASGQ